jgi:phosphoribosylformylglycinamidine synthase II
MSAVNLPGEPGVDLALALAHGLSEAEYRLILQHLGRTPTFTELGVFSVMWSEHCSYKSSRRHLAQFAATNRLVVQGPGENAGAVDIGDGWLAVFKMESHNHPSFVEPYQGAATGVGGILRDIFAMGARPVASLNSLKFGGFDHPRTRHLLTGVVGGIGGYGNCVGVPTIGGEVSFDPAYENNILVNAFCLGLVRSGELQSAKARGVGNPVLYVGSATGRDGIHGASLLASAEFDADSERKRPTVQVGDPFMEKLLIEACLEAATTGAIVALQDMGAAGLTSSSSEMAARGGLGIELDLDRLPLREASLTPYEMLLSESQERMLIVAQKGRERELQAVFEKWDLHAVVLGEITDDRRFKVRFRDQVVADIPVAALADEAPAYDRPMSPVPVPLPPAVRATPTPAQAVRALLDWPDVASKRWVFRQYDSLVQSNTVQGPGADAAVLRLKESCRGLALTVDSNPRACALDPYIGAIASVCEAVRNVACAGARPLGMTDCLNYGSPERPEIMWQFVRGVQGIRDAAIALDTPVISGNVSFYNETSGRAIPPTPAIAVVGLLEDVGQAVTQYFRAPDDVILMLRTAPPSLAASEFQALFGGGGNRLAAIDLRAERTLIELLIMLTQRGLINSAHDVSSGGLAVALAEACFAPERLLGARVTTATPDMPVLENLFGEGTCSVIVSATPANAAAVERLAREQGVPVRWLGQVSAQPRLQIDRLIDESVAELNAIYEQALPRRLRS